MRVLYQYDLGIERSAGRLFRGVHEHALHDTEFIKPPIEAESDSRYVWKLRKALNDLLSTTVDDRRGRAPRDSSRRPQRPSPKRYAFLTSSQGKRWKVFGT